MTNAETETTNGSKQDVIELKPDDEPTQALFSAVLMARRRAEDTGWREERLEHFRKFEEQLRYVCDAELGADR